MSYKSSPTSVINKYEKRRQMMPFFLGVLAGVLALLGILIIVMVVAGANNPFSAMFATKTPTPTMTFTPSPTPMPTETPTITPTAGPTDTPTNVGAQQYVVKADDTCTTLATTFGVDLELLMAINNLDQSCLIYPGTTIIIPAQSQTMPTRTPLPTGLPRGTTITVTVENGDTLQSLADEFDSTVADILLRNKDLTDVNSIYVGQKLTIRINLATRTPTLAPTSTLAVPLKSTPTATPTKKP